MQSIVTKNHELYTQYETKMGETLCESMKAAFGQNVTVIPSRNNIWTQNPNECWGPIEYTVTLTKDQFLANFPRINPLSTNQKRSIRLLTRSDHFLQFSVTFHENPEQQESLFKIDCTDELGNTSILSPTSYSLVSTPNSNNNTTFFDDSLNSPLPNLEIPKDTAALKRDQEERLAQYNEEDRTHLLGDSIMSSPVVLNSPPPPSPNPAPSSANPVSPPSGWVSSVVNYVKAALNWLWSHTIGVFI